MSLDTWKKKFYPKPPSKRMTKRQAVEHSLRKWRGLTESELKKHGLKRVWKHIEEIGKFGELEINAISCALCEKYLHVPGKDFCQNCPLNKVLGEPCDEDEESPYKIWVTKGNPKPMIKALQRALESLDE